MAAQVNIAGLQDRDCKTQAFLGRLHLAALSSTLYDTIAYRRELVHSLHERINGNLFGLQRLVDLSLAGR